jgi:ubiquinone/menaquinone biosynthesis C-methylase UbiE
MELAFGEWQLSLRRQPPSVDKLAASYSASAASWHRQITRLGYMESYAQLFERLVAEGQLSVLGASARVLDCGIGSGALSLALARTIGPRFQLDGVDIAPAMLAEARIQLRSAGLSASLHQQRVERMPFPEASFDALISAHVLEHVADLSASIAEMARVLRPGAPLLLVVSRPGLATALMRLRWHARAYAPGTVLAAMGAAGLAQLRLYPFSSGIPRHWSCAYLGFKAG